MIRSF